MTDALDAAPEGPQTDTLAEQTDTPKPQENMMPEEQPEDTPKKEPKAEKSAEEKRSDTVRKAIDKALEEPKKDDKAEEPKKDDAKKAKEPVADEGKDEKAQDKPQETAQEAKEPPKAEEKPEPKPTAYKEPPSGFDEAAKKEWEAVPESVRGAVHRRAQEMERGIQKYRQDAEAFEPVRQYAEMAKQSGTTLDQALHKYTSMEQQLRQDPMAGLQAVVANLDLKKQDGSPVTLRDVAASIMGQTPDQAASRQEATINRLTQQVQDLTRQLGGFTQHVETQKQEARTTSAQNEWQAFQNENDRAAELEPQIAEFLQKYPNDQMSIRERLQDAYNWAVAQNPSVAHTDPPPLVQTQEKPAANPAGQKSISGASGKDKASSRKLNRSEAIEKAMKAAGI